MKRDTGDLLFNEAKKYIPGGVNSPVRAFKSVGGNPVFIRSAKGAYIFDEDGNQYIDYINSWGPMILGHAHPEVIEAVKSQTEQLFTAGTPTAKELEIAKFIVTSIDHIDKIRFVNSGTEACMSAIRLARGYTGRDKIIKFKGCYHGHAESFLVSAGSGALTFGEPNSPGVPESFAKHTLLADYNNIEQVKDLFKKYGNDIACLIIEPVAGNMGCLPPSKEFLQEVQSVCKEYGSLFIVDEVMTGFRLAWGGASELYELDPDLVCYGKVIGGGMPVGAFAGKDKYFDMLSPNGPVYQAGTLSGNPIAVSSGLKTLELIKSKENFYSNLESKTKVIKDGLLSIFNQKGIPVQVNQIGSMMSLFFADFPIENLDDAKNASGTLFNKYFHHCLNNGIYLPPSAFESWFISDAISEKEIEHTLEISKSFEPA